MSDYSLNNIDGYLKFIITIHMKFLEQGWIIRLGNSTIYYLKTKLHSSLKFQPRVGLRT